MRYFKTISLLLLLLLTGGCVTKYLPEITDQKNLLVVEGMITDNPESYSIKLSISQPLGEATTRNPLQGAVVTVTDDLGNLYNFFEKSPGIYKSDSTKFTGIPGRRYSLHINTYSESTNYNTYESYPVELKQVPKIDSLYYEKVTTGIDEYNHDIQCAQIYLDASDNGENCRYFRWSYSETWKFQLHWDVPNFTCYRTENSYVINLKNTSTLSENRINKYPLYFVDNSTDRLSVAYSINVSQYSLNQDEYEYWEKVRSVSENVGGLYDIVPASITGNVHCVEEPSQAVLGYFSVCGKTSKRLFIKDHFTGQKNFYADCVSDTLTDGGTIPGLGSYVWILMIHQMNPFYIIITYKQGCADCTTRGVLAKPDFGEDKKSLIK